MMGKILSLDQKSNSFWPLVFGLVVLFLPIVLIVSNVTRYTHGIFMYPFDDTFIHLTIADNLLKGNWGVNPNEFSSASSSILYTLLLALFRFFSKSSLVPFVINCLGGIVIVIAVHYWLRKHVINYIAQSVIFFLVIFFTPLPLLVISGMEHTLQCLFCFLFIFYFSDWMEESNYSSKRILPLKLLVYAVLLSTIRFEGLFIIAIAVLLLIGKKKFYAAALLSIVSVAPLLVFGFISVNKGNFFLPNSVLVKSGSFNSASAVRFLYDIVFEKWVYARNGMAALATQRLLIILPLLYLLFKKYIRSTYSFILVFLFGTTILQLSFASTGYLYRYEAYLFFCFMVIVPVLFFKYGKQVFGNVVSLISKFAVFAIAFFLSFPLILRGVTALNKTAQACINIYDQQYQMAMFTRKFYNGNSVAINDIGAVGYFTDSRIIDLWGLADVRVTKSKKQHYWTAPFLDSLSRSSDVQLAIIYDSWFPDPLLKLWNKVATWEIQNNVICGDSIVSFYALNSSSKDLIKAQLKSFEQRLPATVQVKYY
jgi:hypothetical protein